MMNKIYQKIANDKSLKDISDRDIRRIIRDVAKFNYNIDDFFIIRYQTYGNGILKRTYAVCQYILDNVKYEYKCVEVERYLVGAKKKIYKNLCNGIYGGLKMNFYPFNDDCSWKQTSLNHFCINDNPYSHCDYPVIYDNDVKDLIKDTKYRYCALDVLMKTHPGIDPIKYLTQYEEHPQQMEMIVKAGWYDLFSEVRKSDMNWKEKGFRIFGVDTKEKFEFLKNICHDQVFIMNYWYDIKRLKIKTSTEVSILKQLYFVNVRLKKHGTPEIIITRKIIGYIAVKCRYGNEYQIRNVINDYIDYCEWISFLGITQKSSVMCPQNFQKAHDEMDAAYFASKNKVNNELIMKFAIEELAKYRFGDSKYIITPASSYADLIEESKKLHHCVRTYGTRVAKRETAIFLVRRREEPLEPFVTLELNGHLVVQRRAISNTDPDEQTKKFVDKWIKKFHFEFRGNRYFA